jgi:hypothetical protein
MGFFQIAHEFRVGGPELAQEFDQFTPCQMRFDRVGWTKFRNDMAMPLDTHAFTRALDQIEDLSKVARHLGGRECACHQIESDSRGLFARIGDMNAVGRARARGPNGRECAHAIDYWLPFLPDAYEFEVLVLTSSKAQARGAAARSRASGRR